MLIDGEKLIEDLRRYKHEVISVDGLEGIISLMPYADSEDDCDSCKYGYFGDKQCNNCRVRYPSHYERRNDE